MADGMEVERKFLVRNLPALHGARHQRLRQGYLATGHAEVRLRLQGEQHRLTCKRGSGLARQESEIEISAEQFNALWPLTTGSQIDKTRYFIDHGNLLIELDVYHGALESLVVAEVEFPTIEASAVFEAPEWFDVEVTDDARYKNQQLAKAGLPR